MRHERQVELLRRLFAPDAPVPGPLGAASMHNPSSNYTSQERFEDELRVLFGGIPQLAALSCELPTPGSYMTVTIGKVPMLIVRNESGEAKAFLNACRHRGATLMGEGCGEGMRRMSCPYHAWTYDLDGHLVAIPGAEAGFDDIDKATHGLVELPSLEQHGMVFVHPDPKAAPFTVDDALHGAQEELADFGLENYVHIETRASEWKMNWKLVLDTFTEPYHIPWLHKDTIKPYYLYDRWIHDDYGPNPRFIGTRKSVFQELEKGNEDEWSLLPHGTIQYLLIPNAVLVHQMDHFELWRMVPLAVDRVRVVTSVYGPGPEITEKARKYFVKNLDILLNVVCTEDFPAQEGVQRNLSSGAMESVVYGKMEPALANYHRAIDEMILAAGPAR